MHYPLPPPGQDTQPGSFSELRDELRHRIDRPPQGCITLLARSERQRVHLIRDVSAHGVSLVLEHALEPGEPVLIEQSPAPVDLNQRPSPPGTAAASSDEAGASGCIYRAYVVWCRDTEPGCSAPEAHFIAGLRVHGPQSLERLIQHPAAA
jgi:hypothetical protein